ncbi:transporter substrate-binding domain-containing protein [Pseudoalteromonas sp. McH1-42]|uniref:substrate-binding periplasmic protein n=1 Tax=Pseudoalteromonas sp. McH1-42 TaxID=2917752 RepID=UPI001EF4A2F5|nr:transporter substrate-binding domain-containing protein [Pseudoalteromonas sp. McH1-42]MCG7563981.1 transporter substrate-binding domain-containing protein [Pseudoalteromonas sp. McH1-42]
MHWTLVLLMLVGCSFAWASESIRIATGEYPPFTGSKLVDDGFVNHLIRQVLAEAGLSAEFVYLPWKRSFQAAQQGKYDMASYWVCEREYQQHFYCSDELYRGQLLLYFRAETPLPQWHSIDDLKSYRIGAILGYEYVPEFHQAMQKGELDVIMVSNDRLNLNMLLNDRVDLILLSDTAMQSLLAEHFPSMPKDQIQAHPKPFLNYRAHVLFPKSIASSSALRERFNASLKKLKASGEVERQWQRLIKGEFIPLEN